MAGANRRRILRLPCRANQQHGVTCVSIPCRCALAPATVPAQPEGVCGVGADGETGGRIPPKAPYPSPLAKCAVCRQTPEVGAECGNPARSDLCGGTGVTRFPTANKQGRQMADLQKALVHVSFQPSGKPSLACRSIA